MDDWALAREGPAVGGMGIRPGRRWRLWKLWRALLHSHRRPYLALRHLIGFVLLGATAAVVAYGIVHLIG